MEQRVAYSRPPIVEAILDIQVNAPVDVTVDSLVKCHKNIAKGYPERRRTQQVTGEISVGKKLSTSTSSESTGFVFSSTDKKRLFQAKTAGFTFNHLAPYPGWNPFFTEAKRLWEEYRKVVRPNGYSRIALRFVNRFDFPEQIINMETYFRTYLEVSPELPQMMQGFFLQCNLPITEAESTTTITQTIVKPSKDGQASVILDIDLFRTDSLASGKELWPLFETLRIWKNRIFEACITDKARELIR